MKKMPLFGLIALMVILLSHSAMAIGIGLAPSQINIINAMRGSEYERTITIINPGEDATRFSLRIEGDSSEWINFYNTDKPAVKINEMLINSKDNAVVVVKMNIPEDASSGTYKSNIIVETIPDKIDNMQTGVAAKLMAQTDLTIDVTGEQIIDGIAKTISIENTEPSYPVRISTIFQNTGNVVVKPKIMANILQNGNIIGNLIYENTKVKPTLTETIIADWNTTSENIPGDYIANIIVSLNGKELRSETLSFKILPIGTLTRQGNLTEIFIEGELKKGSLLKIKANFKNTGQILSKAKFIGEVYKDGNLIDTVSSEEFEIAREEEAELVSYLRLESNGDYLIKGKVIYSGKETPVEEVSLKVGNSIPGFEGIYLIAIMLLLVMFRGKKNRKM